MSTELGVLGLNGPTACFGLLEVGRPKAGETVVVSTATGAVGSCAGRIARIRGCRTVGIAGGSRKTALCRTAFGDDQAIDPLADRLADRYVEGLGRRPRGFGRARSATATTPATASNMRPARSSA